MTKRIFDFIVSALAIIILLPVMLALALLIKFSSVGDTFFIHDRIGRHERPFSCYKFRTMAKNAPVAGSHDVSPSWITPVGAWLRKLKLDELPQLVNVLKGDMSLVGPRPCLPNQLEVINARRKMGVYAVRPGITGLAQLSRIDMSTPERLAAVDHSYVLNRSFLGDIGILLSTAVGRGTGDAVNK